jgi:DNA-binding protein YbaB
MPETDLDRVHALLESSMGAAQEPVTERVDGIVAVTVGGQFQLLQVQLLDDRIAPEVRDAIGSAIVAATNGAVQRMVANAAKSMLELQRSAVWQERLKEVLKPFGPT